MAGPPSPRSNRSTPLVVGAAAAVVAAVVIAMNLAAVPVPDEPTEGGYVSLYRPADEPLDVVLNQGDGQAYAALAADPLLRGPEVFDQGAPAAAFFGHRVLFTSAAWVAALGRPSATPWGLAVVVVCSAAVLASGAVALAQRRGAGYCARWAGVVVLLPGSLTVMDWLEPGMASLGLAMWGVVAWLDRPERPALAGVLFAAAALTRESSLVIPAVIGAEMLLARRLSWRQGAALAVAPLAYVTWSTVLRLRLGVGPEEVAGGATFALPFAGTVEAASGWVAADVVVAAAGIVLVGLAVARRPWDLATHIAVAYLLGSFVLHVDVWASWQGFGRVLLPMFAFAVLALLPGAGQPSPLRSVGERDPGGLPSVDESR